MGKLVYDGGWITPGYLRSRAKEELVHMVMSYLGAWDGMKQRAELAESSLSSAEKERDGLKAQIAEGPDCEDCEHDRPAMLQENAELRSMLTSALAQRDTAIEGRRMWQGCAEEAAKQRDTALRELAEAREINSVLVAGQNESQPGPWVARAFQSLAAVKGLVQELEEVHATLTSIKTALGCPGLPVEELAGKVEKMRTALESLSESYKPGNMSIISLMGKMAFDALPIHPKEGET